MAHIFVCDSWSGVLARSTHSPSRREERKRVLNFRLSKQLKDSMLAATTLCGSPLYLSSEQAKGTECCTLKCDVGAVGVILYEINSPKHVLPFVGRSLPHLLQLIQLHVAVPLPTTTPRVVAEMCVQLLPKNPSARPCAHEVLKRPSIIDNAGRLGLAVLFHDRPSVDSIDSFLSSTDDDSGQRRERFFKMLRVGAARDRNVLRPRMRKKAYCEVCAAHGEVADAQFTSVKRRHHCRMCGRSVCSEHAVGRQCLPNLGYSSPQLLCETCFLLPRDGAVRRKFTEECEEDLMSVTSNEMERASLVADACGSRTSRRFTG